MLAGEKIGRHEERCERIHSLLLPAPATKRRISQILTCQTVGVEMSVGDILLTSKL
jgi:hypothetical protein